MNVAQKALVDPIKILLPPLHVKIGIVRNFSKVMDKNGEGFPFSKRKFPKLCEAIGWTEVRDVTTDEFEK